MSRRKDRSTGSGASPMLFGKKNYQWAAIGCLLVFSGFLIMYLESEIHGWISLYLSPWMILSGFGLVLFAIVWRFDREAGARNSTGSADEVNDTGG